MKGEAREGGSGGTSAWEGMGKGRRDEGSQLKGEGLARCTVSVLFKQLYAVSRIISVSYLVISEHDNQ